MSDFTSLKEIFIALDDEPTYRAWTKTRIIKITLGYSVIRVFEKETKKDLIKILSRIPVEEVICLSTQEEFDGWHLQQVTKIYNSLKKRPANIKRLSKSGLK